MDTRIESDLDMEKALDMVAPTLACHRNYGGQRARNVLAFCKKNDLTLTDVVIECHNDALWPERKNRFWWEKNATMIGYTTYANHYWVVQKPPKDATETEIALHMVRNIVNTLKVRKEMAQLIIEYCHSHDLTIRQVVVEDHDKGWFEEVERTAREKQAQPFAWSKGYTVTIRYVLPAA